MSNIGNKLRILRIMKGLSQENMADMLGVARSTYGNIERESTEASKERLQKIAKTLNLSVEDLESMSDRVSNFFDQCDTPQVLAGGINGTVNNYAKDAEQALLEAQHKIELQQKELENKNLEIRLLKAEKEKAELEARLTREK